MLLDSGVCVLYQVKNTAAPGRMPKPALEERARAWYGELTVGVTRYNTALQANGRVDMLVRIWQDRAVSTGDICEIEGIRYRVRQLQHRRDEDGLNVTDLELTKLEATDELT